MKTGSKFGWVELLLGILLIALSIFTFIQPGAALTSLVVIYGIIAVITGIADIVVYVRLERRTGFGPSLSLVTGTLSILAGMALLIFPNAGRLVLAIVFPIWFIAHCISRLVNLGWTRIIAGNAVYYFSLVVYTLGLVLGFLLLFNPSMSVATMGFLIAIALLLFGVVSIVAAFTKPKRQNYVE